MFDIVLKELISFFVLVKTGNSGGSLGAQLAQRFHFVKLIVLVHLELKRLRLKADVVNEVLVVPLPFFRCLSLRQFGLCGAIGHPFFGFFGHGLSYGEETHSW